MRSSTRKRLVNKITAFYLPLIINQSELRLWNKQNSDLQCRRQRYRQQWKKVLFYVCIPLEKVQNCIFSESMNQFFEYVNKWKNLEGSQALFAKNYLRTRGTSPYLTQWNLNKDEYYRQRFLKKTPDDFF